MSIVLEFLVHLGRSLRRALNHVFSVIIIIIITLIITLVSSISRDREEELLNYWPPVRSVYPQTTQIKIVGTS